MTPRLLPSSVIRTTTLADMTGRIVSATRLTDVADAIVGPSTLVFMAGAVVCAASLFCVPWRIIRSAYAEGAVRCSAGTDSCAVAACASAAMA